MRINEKLGMKPQTQKRQATHGPQVVSSAQCPKCGNRHVIRSVSVPGRLMCGACSHFWMQAESS